MKHTSLKRNHKGLLNILAGLGAILALGSVDNAEARHRQSSFGLNLSYQSGRATPGYVGAPFFGYGGAANGFGAINGCFTGAAGGGFIPGPGGGGGGFMPGPVPPMMPQPPMVAMPRPSIPPMPPLIPPHAGGGPFLGSSVHGGGGMGIPGPAGFGCQTICSGGVPYAYGPPPMMGPVPGGPLLGPGMPMGPGAFAQGQGMYQDMHSGRSTASAGSSSSIIHVPAGGTTIIDMSGKNAWEMTDTADIMWSTALGLGMTTTNVFPYHGPRNAVTNLNLMYSSGPRNYNFQPRPHAAP